MPPTTFYGNQKQPLIYNSDLPFAGVWWYGVPQVVSAILKFKCCCKRCQDTQNGLKWTIDGKNTIVFHDALLVWVESEYIHSTLAEHMFWVVPHPSNCGK